MKFVPATPVRSGEAPLPEKAKFVTHSGENRAEKPPMNVNVPKPDRFAPKKKETLPQPSIKSPLSSSIRGDPKKDKPVSNEDIMALLLKALNK